MPRPKGSKNKPKAEGAKAKKKGGKAAERESFKAPLNTKTGAAGAETQAKGGRPSDGAPPVKGSEVTRVTGASTLKSLLKECAGHKADVDEIVGSLREKIAYAVQHKHLDKRAFAELRKLDKMASDKPEKASDYWHTLVRYMELTGVMAKIEAVGRLPLGDDDGPAPRGEVDGEDEAGEAEQPQGIQPAETEQPQGETQEADSEAEEAAAEAEAGNVSRPAFGQRSAPMSQSEQAEARRAAAGLKH